MAEDVTPENNTTGQKSGTPEPQVTPGKSPQTTEKVRGGRGFLFDLYDEMSNASFIHFNKIKKYQDLYKRKLVTYSAMFAHPGGIIINEDAETIEGILRSCDLTKFEGLDLMVHSPGGMPDAAGDIIRVCRTYSPSFRVIVPNMAMSAATVLAMGADAVVMSDTSKLGPIDPQMVYQTKEGTFMRAANSFIQAFGSLVTEANTLSGTGQPIAAHLHLLTKQDPSWIIECVRARNATVKLACRVLKNGMLKTKNDAEIAAVVNSFLTKGDEESHASRVTPEEASAMGLVVEKVSRDSDYWELIWELYVRTDHYTKAKLLAKYICADTGGIEMQMRQLALGGA
jgi:ATP-dependent protease ClpP protease subunit